MINEEKRKYKRVPVSFAMLYAVKLPFAVRVIMGDRERSAVANDIGEGGMSLLTNFEIPVDALLEVKFTLTNEAVLNKDERTRNFELDGQACYCVAAPDSSYRLGVSFIDISPQERVFISNYIKSNVLPQQDPENK